MNRHLTRLVTANVRRTAYANTRYPIASRAAISRVYCQSKPPPPPPTATATKPVETKASSATITPTTTTTSTEVKATPEPTPTIPDIQSTGLGLEEPEDDPKKWQKFAWKYLGSIVVFAIAFKTVNWYADGLEKEGKLKRDEVEERKIARKEYEEEKEELRKNIEQVRLENERLQNQATAATAVPSLAEPFTPIQETQGFVSQVDQLRAYRKDLLDELNNADKARKVEIKDELVYVDAEIDELTK